jgi:hypothetical protein
VVQQKQGRVQPTMQLQGVNVNDNEGLEHEADVMGERSIYENFNVIEPKIEKCSTVKNIIQREKYINSRTEITVDATVSLHNKRITLDDGSYIKWTNRYELHTISASGGGRGTLLVYLFARLAKVAGNQNIDVLAPAPTAIDFYRKTGFMATAILQPNIFNVSGNVEDIIKATRGLWITHNSYIFIHRPKI